MPVVFDLEKRTRFWTPRETVGAVADSEGSRERPSMPVETPAYTLGRTGDSVEDSGIIPTRIRGRPWLLLMVDVWSYKITLFPCVPMENNAGHHRYCRLFPLAHVGSRFPVEWCKRCTRYSFGSCAMAWDTFTRGNFHLMVGYPSRMRTCRGDS